MLPQTKEYNSKIKARDVYEIVGLWPKKIEIFSDSLKILCTFAIIMMMPDFINMRMTEIAKDNPKDDGIALTIDDWVQIVPWHWWSTAMKIHRNWHMKEVLMEFDAIGYD